MTHSDSRVAVCTSDDSEETREAAARFGADLFLSKHRFDWEEVTAFVKKASEQWQGLGNPSAAGEPSVPRG